MPSVINKAKVNHTRNPYNAESELFKKLTRFFSGPIVDFRKQLPRAERRRQLDKYKFTSTSGQRFKKIQYNPFEQLQTQLLANQNRLGRYQEYNAMEFEPIIQAALDLVSDEITYSNEMRPLLNIDSPNEEIKNILHSLYYDVLNIEFNLFGWVRTMLKFGDFFMYLDIDEELGVKNMIGLPPQEIERLEGEDKTNPQYTVFQWNSGGITFENWQMAHFRILGNDKYNPYGCCHKYDTRILTNSGVKEIKDVGVGDHVWCYNLTDQKKYLTKVLDAVSSGVKKCFRIGTKHNFLECSKEHRILTIDNNVFKYKSAEDIKIGDKLLVNKSFDFNTPVKLDKNKPEGKNYNGFWNSVDLLPDFVDEELAQLLGFMFGDGWIGGKNRLEFALGVYEDINQKYIKLLEKYSGQKIILRKPHTTSNTKLELSQAICCSKMLVTMFKRLGFTSYAHKKRIPSWVYSASASIKEAFIDGFVDADGSIFCDKWNCNRYSIELCNEQLIKDLKNLVQSLGYKSGKISTRKRINQYINGKKINNGSSFYFYFFKSRITQIKTHSQNINSDECVVSPVISIEDIGDYETYDIHVENENHNFFANGIVTHNSYLDASRRIFRMLDLVENYMLGYRAIRSAEKRVFYMDVGNIPPEEVEQFMQQTISSMKRNSIVDPTTGKIDLRMNTMDLESDFYIPVRGESSTKIETLPGGEMLNDIEDVKYLRNKLVTALKIPEAYLIRGEEGSVESSSLSQQDLRFARTVQRLQRIVTSELEKIGIIHLFTLGFRGKDLITFKLRLNNPSKIAELQELEHWRTKFDVASAATEGFFSKRWVAENIFKITNDEFLRNQREMYSDRQFGAQLEKIGEMQLGEGGAGGGIGDLGGGDLGGGSPSDSDLLSGDQGNEESKDDSMLLAKPSEAELTGGDNGAEPSPGRRDDRPHSKKPYLTPGAKGKLYYPTPTDTRDMGGRRRHYHSEYHRELASDTPRNVLKGSMHLFENKDSNYSYDINDERLITETSFSIRQLVEQLEKIDNSKKAKDKIITETTKTND